MEEANPENFIIKELWFMNVHSTTWCLIKRHLPCIHKMEISVPHPTAHLKKNCSPASLLLRRGPDALQHHCKEPHGKVLWKGNKRDPEKKAEGMTFMLHRFVELQSSSTANSKVTKSTGGSQKIPNLPVSGADILFVDRNKLKQLHFVYSVVIQDGMDIIQLIQLSYLFHFSSTLTFFVSTMLFETP